MRTRFHCWIQRKLEKTPTDFTSALLLASGRRESRKRVTSWPHSSNTDVLQESHELRSKGKL